MIARLALVLVGLVLVAEAGHQVLDQLNLELAHHVFHLMFPLVAFALFAVFAARDIQQRGWPRFSWSLSPSSPPRER